jgi:hypothetical protein
VEKVEVKQEGSVRRAKLYYLRDRVGKAAKVKRKIRSAAEIEAAKLVTTKAKRAKAEAAAAVATAAPAPAPAATVEA